MANPPILNRLVSQLVESGKDIGAAHAIAISKLREYGELEPTGLQATAKGERRGKMTPGERAIDRASEASGHPASRYRYNAKTNRATLIKWDMRQ